MKDKNKMLTIACHVLIGAIAVTLLWGLVNGKHVFRDTYSDGIEQIDLDTIYLNRSNVEVDFSEVLVGTHEEMRKLIVSTQEATVSTELTAELIRQLDFDFLKKTQKVSYTGKGYFVVDLDHLTKDRIVQDKQKKTVTIKIDHAYLQAIEIDPEKIIIDEVKEGLLARGDIKLTVQDYNAIEKELRNRMEEKFDTAENGQRADAIALEMVKAVYEPVIRAIDAEYELHVTF